MKYTELKEVFQCKHVKENLFEILLPRSGNLAGIQIFAPTFSLVQLKVGGEVVWSDVGSCNTVKLPKINMLKTDWHEVLICVESSIETILVEVTYWLLDDVMDKRRLAIEGLPSIYGWQYLGDIP